LVVALAACCTLSAGCGGSHAPVSPERPAPPSARETAPGGSAPEQAIRGFATAYINWTATSVAGDMRALANVSIGQARSAMQLAAAETAGDYELQQGGIANSGTVEAVAPLPGRRNQYAVVTLEETTATASNAYQGLAPSWHLAVATVVEAVPGRWVVSGWQPEN
jgi:hypothetical protein